MQSNEIDFYKVFSDVIMVLFAAVLIMLVSIDQNEIDAAESGETENAIEEIAETIELPTNSSGQNSIETGLIIEMLDEGFNIRFNGQQTSISSGERLINEVMRSANSEEPDIILLASPESRFQEIIDVLGILDSGIGWTTPQVGTF